jgi:hypothetical protein
MRPIERIDNFLSKVDWNKFKDTWKIEFSYFEDLLNSPLTYAKFREYWKENPDQRIGQVLINLNLIPDNMRIWLDEESDILIDQGIPPEECLYWTSMYDKEDNLLEKPITRLIKDLEPNHIKKILKMCYPKLSENYRKAFDNVLQAYCPGITYDIE